MNTAEFVVSVAASVGFLVGLGTAILDWRILVPLLVGGLIAAPIAARIAHRLPMRIMGVSVGGLIVVTNTFTLLRAFAVPGATQGIVMGLLLAAWITVVTLVSVQHRRTRSAQPVEAHKPSPQATEPV